ncbi:winged helix-turn-helix domain-containing protein [Streptomyces netropsis]
MVIRKESPLTESRVESADWPTWFTMVPEWVTFAPVSDRAHRIYTVFAAHLRRDSRCRTTGVITQDDIAAVVGLTSNPDRVRRYIAELEKLGAVRVIEDWDHERKIRLVRYLVRFNPPPGYTGYLRVQAWQDERRAARITRLAARRAGEKGRKESEAAGHPESLKNEGTESLKNEGTESLKNEGCSPYVHASDETTPDRAPSAQGAASASRSDAVAKPRTSHAGARARGTSRAATSSTGKKPQTASRPGTRMTSEEAAAVRAVEATFPPELSMLLPRYRPRVLKLAILESLNGRTAAQVADRVHRRWHAHGYAEALHSESGRGIGSPVGVAVALVRPPNDCPDLSCEDGIMIDSGNPCQTCRIRRADRRTRHNHRLPTNSQNFVPGRWWECAVCDTPYRGDAPMEGICSGCQTDQNNAETAVQRLAEELRRRLACDARADSACTYDDGRARADAMQDTHSGLDEAPLPIDQAALRMNHQAAASQPPPF